MFANNSAEKGEVFNSEMGSSFHEIINIEVLDVVACDDIGIAGNKVFGPVFQHSLFIIVGVDGHTGDAGTRAHGKDGLEERFVGSLLVRVMDII